MKDAEFNPDARTGAYGGYLPWVERAGRFRSVGDGQIDFPAIFAKLAQYDYDGWAVLSGSVVSKILLPVRAKVLSASQTGSYRRFARLRRLCSDRRRYCS